MMSLRDVTECQASDPSSGSAREHAIIEDHHQHRSSRVTINHRSSRAPSITYIAKRYSIANARP